MSCLGVSTTSSLEENPPAEGFDLAGSDSLAILLADQVMGAMGGRAAWDNTRFLRWNFFGSRLWYWDKWTGDVRMEVLKDDTRVLYNLQSGAGQVYKYGKEWQDPDTLAMYLEKTRQAWINDSYWLFMPFKLKDSGVTIQALGLDTLSNGQAANVLELRFQGVGVTPQNKYHVWVDTTDSLIKQWAFYGSASDPEPAFITPWEGYQKFGEILLAPSRGESRTIENIGVFETLDPAIFDNLAPVK